jgi:outer membrane protein
MRRNHPFYGIALFVVLGGVLGMEAAQAQQPYRLTLQDAIERALSANVNGLLARERIAAAEGTRLRRYSAAMLPRVSAETYANVQNRDLAAFGISFPGLPQVVGPFSNYDARIYAQQNIIDLASLHGLRASERAVDAGKLDSQDVRDQIVRSVASIYLQAESAEARAVAAQTRVGDSNRLLKLAQDRHDAGVATGVDVLRAQVQLANDKQALLIEQNQYQQALLALARSIGIDPGVPIELAEALRFELLTEPEAGTLAQAALATRADYLSLAAQRQSLVEQQSANRARWYPKLSISGNYGAIGRNVGGMQGTGLLQAQIDVPVFDRDRNGEAQELASQVRGLDDRIADLRRGVEEDVREALLNLDSAAQQVDVAEQGQGLAGRELQLAQDRFEQGTANNVEVVTAQDELARAQENYILAVTSHVDAKFALARALGDTEKNIAGLAPAGK